jgi:beta-lactamase regulating signal transducer with metallopeptidase domain
MNPATFADFGLRSLVIGGMAWAVLSFWPPERRSRARESIAIGALALLLWSTAALLLPLPHWSLASHPLPSLDGLVQNGSLWRMAVCVWLLGVAAALVRDAVGAWRVRRLVRDSVPLDDPGWSAALLDARKALGEWRGVDLRATREFGPAAAGLLRRTILLPDASRDWSARIKRMVLLHELAHFRRHDLAIQAVARLAFAFQWFNPFAHALVRQIEMERELACDQAVSQRVDDPGDYAAHLLDLASERFHHEAAAPALALISRPVSLLERRVRCLLAPVRPASLVSRLGEAIVVGLSILTLAACSISNPAGSTSADDPWTPAEIERRLAANPFPDER